MPRYTVRQKYYARRDGVEYGPWPVGTGVELEAEVGDWVNRDAPGTLTPEALPEPDPEPEVAEEPAAEEEEPERDAKPTRDRQHRGGRTRKA
jgi:hypothetical protein